MKSNNTPTSKAVSGGQHMSRWLALATEPEIETQTPPDNLTKPDKTLSTSAPDTDEPRSTSICGRPKTWTGKIVSLDEWRKVRHETF